MFYNCALCAVVASFSVFYSKERNEFRPYEFPDLQNRGYGWLRPEGVRIKLEELRMQFHSKQQIPYK